MSFSSDGKSFLAPSYHDGSVRIWSFPALKLHREFKHGKAAHSAFFLADGKQIISGGSDNILRLWDIENDRQEKTYEGHEKPVRLVRPFAGGERIVSVCEAGKVIVWNLKSGKQERTCSIDNVARLPFYGASMLAVAAKGHRLLVGHQDGSLTYWDLDKGEQAGKLAGHKKGAVTAVDITPDGRYALSCGEDMTLRYWRLPPAAAATKTLKSPVEKK